MWQTLEALRRQPRAKRERVALLGATIITGTIALVWVSTLPERLAETAAVVSGDETTTSGGMFADFVARVNDGFALFESDTELPETTLPAATVVASPTTTPAVVIPQLDAETIADVMPPRIIQLGTSTATSL